MQAASKPETRLEAAPFIKWAGGKTQLLPKLNEQVPRFTRYFEPFVGGGALFFHLAARQQFNAYLSDANSDLVNAYTIVKNKVEELICLLELHDRHYKQAPTEYYYNLRSDEPRDRLESAARFIALNKTCYNGLYRVNKSGKFNVPMGRYKNPTICDKAQLRTSSAALNRCDAKIVICDYPHALKKAKDGDFIYLDPPFHPLSSTARFVDYTRYGFGVQDQAELAKVFTELDGKGCKVLLSNSDTRLTRKLYSGFVLSRVKAMRAISCRGSTRTGYRELMVRNYAL